MLSAAEEAPEKPGRSKLEPVADVVATLRRKRWSYREIADFLKEKANLTVDPSTIYDFVKSQAKRGRKERKTVPISPQIEVAKNEAATSTVLVDPALKTSIPKPKRSVYIPQFQIPPAFDPALLKTNDESEE